MDAKDAIYDKHRAKDAIYGKQKVCALRGLTGLNVAAVSVAAGRDERRIGSARAARPVRVVQAPTSAR